MAKHNELGIQGEKAVAVYLEQNGYSILHRNWKLGHWELDIVALKEGELVVVEVKTRSTTHYSMPEDAVDLPKIKRLVHATDVYMKKFKLDIPVRFDILTVVGQNGNFKIDHIKNAFFSPLF